MSVIVVSAAIMLETTTNADIATQSATFVPAPEQSEGFETRNPVEAAPAAEMKLHPCSSEWASGRSCHHLELEPIVLRVVAADEPVDVIVPEADPNRRASRSDATEPILRETIVFPAMVIHVPLHSERIAESFLQTSAWEVTRL